MLRLPETFDPFVHRQALNRHDRDRPTQYTTRRELQPFMRSWRIAEADHISRGPVAINCCTTPDNLCGYLMRIHPCLGMLRHLCARLPRELGLSVRSWSPLA